jgi:heat shock protein HslJ
MTIPGQRLLAILALAAPLTACASTSDVAEPPSLAGTAWILSALPGHTRVEKTSVTLHFEGDRVSGTDGCNRFSGGYTAAGSTLELSPQMAMTMMACDPDVSEQAQAFVAALKDARSFRISDGRLELLAADASLRAALVAQSQALTGSAWEVTGLNNGREAVVSLVADSKVTLAFGSDGLASGSAGCNRYNTRFEAEGPSLRFEPAASTRRMCVEPEGVMEQEQQFLSALAKVTSARIEGDRLELRAADGALALTLARSAGD